MKEIIANKIQCRHCGDIIESKIVHDFVTCKCGYCSVDGGKYYLKRIYRNSSEEDYIDLSEIADI